MPESELVDSMVCACTGIGKKITVYWAGVLYIFSCIYALTANGIGVQLLVGLGWVVE
jgi:hypothetical protein